MKKTDKRQYFVSEDDEKFFFKANGTYQSITLCRETDDDEIMQIDYRNACLMFDLLEKSISYLEEDD